MRKSVLVVGSLLLFVPALLAQNKIDSKWHCPKTDPAAKLNVGDVPDHFYAIQQGECTATASDKGFEEKSAAFTEFDEGWKNSTSARGRFNVTMANGDKVFYSYAHTIADGKSSDDSWKIVSGTGKNKGIKGSGKCMGTLNQDGSSDWQCTGTYTRGM